MDCRLNLASIGGVAAPRCRIISAAQLRHLSFCIFNRFATGDEIGVSQTHFGAGREPKEFFWRILHEVVLLDIKLAAEFYFPYPGVRIIGMVRGIELLNLAVGIVFNTDFYRPQDRHPAHGGPVENLAHGEIEHAHINNAICLGHADPLDEIADRLGWNATATQSRKSWHAWIVPAIDVTVTNQFGENALRQYCVSQVKPGELILMRLRRHLKVRNEPIVKRTMVFEFQR